LIDLFKEIINDSLSVAQQHGLELIFRQNCQTPEGVVDQKLIHLIINNLLSNSIKYSKAGGQIILDLSCEEKELILTIQDYGVGIPPQDIPHLFEAFHRAENVSHLNGTGLGLYTVKQAIDSHKGKIEITSELGIGTTVTVQFPRISQPRLFNDNILFF
jgi:signal transduction histidine kinase